MAGSSSKQWYCSVLQLAMAAPWAAAGLKLLHSAPPSGSQNFVEGSLLGWDRRCRSRSWPPSALGNCKHGGERGSVAMFVQRRAACEEKRKGIIANAEKKKTGGISFGDQLLDYIEGGPKLRKWYGAPDQLPKDGGTTKKEEKPVDVSNLLPFSEPVEEEDLNRNVVLVTDADSETGQLVVLELILRRLRVRALVRDIKAATVGFGAYVEPVEGDVNDKEILRKVMRDVRAIICPSKVGELADKELVRGVEHLVLLSKLAVNRNQGGLGSLFSGRSRRDVEVNEAAISSLGVPYTIVRAGLLKNERGGQLGFRYGQGGVVQGTISREDAAYVCVEALKSPPRSALVFEVVNGQEEVGDWSAVFTSLKETITASGS